MYYYQLIMKEWTSNSMIATLIVRESNELIVEIIPTRTNKSWGFLNFLIRTKSFFFQDKKKGLLEVNKIFY